MARVRVVGYLDPPTVGQLEMLRRDLDLNLSAVIRGILSDWMRTPILDLSKFRPPEEKHEH